MNIIKQVFATVYHIWKYLLINSLRNYYYHVVLTNLN